MATENETLNTLQEIRSMMQRSSRFISLSGLSGIFSGVFALVGAWAAWWRTHSEEWIQRVGNTAMGNGQIKDINRVVIWFLILDALLVLSLSIAVSLYFTRKKALKNKQPMWGPYSRPMLINLAIPLLTGGIFSVILFYHGLIGLIAPAILIFYGLALINAGKYVFEEISYLGITEIVLGLFALYFTGQGLLFWAIGFGIMHIVYGALMYFRHDK